MYVLDPQISYDEDGIFLCIKQSDGSDRDIVLTNQKARDFAQYPYVSLLRVVNDKIYVILHEDNYVYEEIVFVVLPNGSFTSHTYDWGFNDSIFYQGSMYIAYFESGDGDAVTIYKDNVSIKKIALSPDDIDVFDRKTSLAEEDGALYLKYRSQSHRV